MVLIVIHIKYAKNVPVMNMLCGYDITSCDIWFYGFRGDFYNISASLYCAIMAVFTTINKTKTALMKLPILTLASFFQITFLGSCVCCLESFSDWLCFSFFYIGFHGFPSNLSFRT